MRKNQNTESLLHLGYENDDIKLLETIYKICEKGCDAEVRKNKDGTLKVYEVKKRIAS